MSYSETDDLSNMIEQAFKAACARHYMQGLLDAAKRCVRLADGASDEDEAPIHDVTMECAKAIREMAENCRKDAEIARLESLERRTGT